MGLFFMARLTVLRGGLTIESFMKFRDKSRVEVNENFNQAFISS